MSIYSYKEDKMKRIFKYKKGIVHYKIHGINEGIGNFLHDFIRKSFYSKERKHYVDDLQEDYRIEVIIKKVKESKKNGNKTR